MVQNKLIALIGAALLTGCTTYVPVKTPLPEAPAALQQSCPALEQVPNGAQMSDVTNTVVDNYSKYHTCSALEQGWRDWYSGQKQLTEKKPAK